ncbi:hypothetical protein MU1_36890 [Paenibacillus glycanilyticus]|uniref:Uncharacterized protein n=1 Tax=Paenibacillus glycanilyticus TaxID=126569 RepID=A0ABQ6GEL6_9BACL|nr:hypothetical protein MU1_36890 [Paenibacillus glycanilyticus]
MVAALKDSPFEYNIKDWNVRTQGQIAHWDGVRNGEREQHSGSSFDD